MEKKKWIKIQLNTITDDMKMS